MTTPRIPEAIALFFYVGRLRPMPGTWGSLAATLLAWPILEHWGPRVLAIIAGVVALVGLWACDRYEQATGRHDAGEVVVDEVVGQWYTLLGLVILLGRVPLWPELLAGFVAFRLFDIVKPWPFSVLDRKIPGGFGTMIDDMLIALPATALLWLLYAFTPIL